MILPSRGDNDEVSRSTTANDAGALARGRGDLRIDAAVRPVYDDVGDSGASWDRRRRLQRSQTTAAMTNRPSKDSTIYPRCATAPFPGSCRTLKCLYLVVRSLDPTGKGHKRWITCWKPALNAFAITFEGRIFPNDTK